MASEEFRNQLLKKMDQQISTSRRASYHGEAIRTHDEHTAEELLRQGLGVLKLTDKDLAPMSKGDPRKQVLAWWLREQTMIRNEWLARRLAMGHVSAVSKSVNVVATTSDQTLVNWKKRLEQIPRFTA